MVLTQNRLLAICAGLAAVLVIAVGASERLVNRSMGARA